jgi:uncharacterized protein
VNLIINNLRVLVENDTEREYMLAAAEKTELYPKDINFIKILSKAIDARDQKQFYYEISIAVSVPDTFDNKKNFLPYIETVREPKEQKTLKDRPIIIGFGPAGIFAALELIEYGIKPIIFERGKKIEDRAIDVQKFIKEGTLNPESNIQFGEGGAGSFSDGKLFSRLKNSTYLHKVLDTFIKFGAPEEISYAQKPHLGTDVLCKIVHNMREHILSHGGEIHYSSKMTDMLITDNEISGIVINGEKEYKSSLIYLALGHSARDTFEMIYKKGVTIEQKAIAVGVRLEHPAETINFIRYGHKYKNVAAIGAASYSFNYTDQKMDRGAYTFCMCPGGEIVNASSEEGLLVTNGMSYSKRDSAFSNAAIIVTCHTEDYKSSHPLAGLLFQKNIERKAFTASGGNWKVPAQNLMDFLYEKTSVKLNENSCKTGTISVNMNTIFPKFIRIVLKRAFNKWKENYPVFVSSQATLLAPETRTSCPIRISRKDNWESVNMKNLYPIGEGSGYTGGITSSALDAIKAVENSLLNIN